MVGRMTTPAGTATVASASRAAGRPELRGDQVQHGEGVVSLELDAWRDADRLACGEHGVAQSGHPAIQPVVSEQCEVDGGGVGERMRGGQGDHTDSVNSGTVSTAASVSRWGSERSPGRRR